MKKDGKRFAVVACVDSNFIWQAAYTLARAHASDTANEVDHYLYTSEPVDPKYEQTFGHLFYFVHSSVEALAGSQFQSHPYVSPATLLRLYALQDLAQRYDHVLYLDADVVQRWGKPTDLLQLKDFSQPIAAVMDNKRWRLDKIPKNADNDVLPAGAKRRYFNAGVLFVNSAALLRDQVIETAISALANARPALPLADQSALNIAVDGNWLELSPSWNWQFSYLPDPAAAIRNPRFVHFTGPVKPWTNPRREIGEVYTASMAAFLRRFGLLDELDQLYAGSWNKAHEVVRFTKRSIFVAEKIVMREHRGEAFFARTDFADMQSGIDAYGMDGAQTRDKYPDLFDFPQPTDPNAT